MNECECGGNACANGKWMMIDFDLRKCGTC